MIKLVLTDIDDTLIPYGAPCASERTRAAIQDRKSTRLNSSH